MAREYAGLTGKVKDEARRLGFDLAGVTGVRPSEHGDFYRAWIEAGRHGEMGYLAREDAVARRLEMPGAFQSALVVGLNYYQGEREREREREGRGIIAQYAHGRDYHKVLKAKLLSLLRFVEAEIGHGLPLARAYVDTGPVLERELARRAGLGWFGRNTMLINPKRGSYFFLGSLLLEIELDSDEAFTEDHCGTCSACVTACPTGALLGRDENGAPVMDATRCISYLTIEQRGAIPVELRPLIGDRIFGCDICQEVCPWNSPKFVQVTREASFFRKDAKTPRNLIDLMRMDEAGWEVFSRGSAMRRAKRSGFLRNVAVALGNVGDAEALPVLHEALNDPEPLVREHAAWAIEQIGKRQSSTAMSQTTAPGSDAKHRRSL